MQVSRKEKIMKANTHKLGPVSSIIAQRNQQRTMQNSIYGEGRVENALNANVIYSR